MGLLERCKCRMEWYVALLTQAATTSRSKDGTCARPSTTVLVSRPLRARRGTSPFSPSFDGGVTSIQSHATRQHYWAVGSYDETIRIFDARNPRRPVADAPVGGGIWRAKWHPTNENALLLGCMHGGVRIVEWSPDAPIEVVCEFDQHESIAYGCDWERGAFRGTDTPDASYVYSCSFYDAALHVWAWP